MDLKIKYYQLSHTLFFVKQRVFSTLSFLLPDNRIASSMRVALLRLFGVQAGENCNVRGGVQFQEGFQLTLADNVFINSNALFDTAAPISIGRDVQIAYQVTFVTGGHEIGTHESRAGLHKPEPIVVGDGVWIGARAVILPGVTIGDGAVVASGSVVTKDVLPDSLVGGVPARCIRLLD